MRFPTPMLRRWSPFCGGPSHPAALLCIALLLALVPASIAQQPVPQLPAGITLTGGSYVGTVMQTSYSQPTGGTTWAAHTATDLKNAFAKSQPGDVIVLDAGSTYTGNFNVPAKANPSNQWIYIISSALASLPEGTRVSPSSAVNMPKLVTPNATPVLAFSLGANYYRFAGVELASASTYLPSGYTPGVYYGYAMVAIANPWPWTANVPDHIIFDRDYVHGSSTQDRQAGLQINFSNVAVVDSYISEIHMKNTDTCAVGAFYTPGPVKITNNYLSAAGENIMFGGSGQNYDLWVPSDIEIRFNSIDKPLTWVPMSTGSNPVYTVKNAFELKSAQRVLFDTNNVTNVWAAAQLGYAVPLTVRTSQSGDIAVVDDITITNNAFQNVVSGINGLAKDDACGTSSYPNCHNAGSQDRWRIANNLFTFFDPTLPGGQRNVGFLFSRGIDHPNGGTLGNTQDVLFQHNTMVSAPSTPCFISVWFSGGGEPYPPTSHITNNVWILDNVLCSQPMGDLGLKGTSGLNLYMAYPNTPPYDVTQRYYGNVMLQQSGTAYTWPTSNDVTPAVTYVAPTSGNYQLWSPNWTSTSDGNLAGVDMTKIP